MRQNTLASVILFTTMLIANGCGSEGSTVIGTAGATGGAGNSIGNGSGGGAGVAAVVSGTGGAHGTSNMALVDRYAGTWRYVSGTGTTVCGPDSETNVLTGTLQLGKGIDSDLVQINETCSIKIDVGTGAAMVRDGQTCFAAEGSESAELRYRAWTFSTTDGRTMTENGSATITFDDGIARITCDVTVSGTLTKVAL